MPALRCSAPRLSVLLGMALAMLLGAAQVAMARTYLCQSPATLAFAHRSAELDVTAQRTLLQVAAGPCRPVVIEGYADPEEAARGAEPARLALARAEAAAGCLTFNGLGRDGIAVRAGDADLLRSAGAMGAPAERNRIVVVLFACCEGSPISSDSGFHR
jgi:hypothetical protein